MPEKLKQSADKLKWVSFEFTIEEDICLVNSDGTLYLMDPKTGELRDNPISLGLDFATTNIADSKLIDNMLIFRTIKNKFYWVSNIS